MLDQTNLTTFHKRFPDEQACRYSLESIRWGNRIVCPKCDAADEAYRYNDGILYKCAACHKQFSVRSGTIFEDSKLPLQKWFLAIYLASGLNKGVSSTQLSKYLGITQKTAWLMLRRIRYAIGEDSYDKSLDGLQHKTVKIRGS